MNGRPFSSGACFGACCVTKCLLAVRDAVSISNWEWGTITASHSLMATRLNRRFRLSGESKSRSVTARTLAEGLAQFPEMGRVGRVEGTRELVISKLPTLPHIALPATRCVYCVCCAAHNSGRTRCRKYLSRSDSSSWACWLIGLPPPGCG